MQPHTSLPSYVFTIVLVVVVLGLRLWRSGIGRRGGGAARRLRLEFLWVMPAIMTLGAVALLVQLPPTGWEWPLLAAVFAAGAGLGWYRGTLIPIEVDRETHALETPR